MVSTHFFRCNFSGRKTHVVFNYFFLLILMLEKSTLFAHTFFDEISAGKNPTSFLGKLQANNENITGGFPLLVTLKN